MVLYCYLNKYNELHYDSQLPEVVVWTNTTRQQLKIMHDWSIVGFESKSYVVGRWCFKNGHLKQLENKLEAKIPRCGLKASRHIESRFKWFKQKCCAISNMLSLSGFGCDADNIMIICEKYILWVYQGKVLNCIVLLLLLHLNLYY